MAKQKSNKAVIKLTFDNGTTYYDEIIAKFNALGDAVIAAKALNDANISNPYIHFSAHLANSAFRFA